MRPRLLGRSALLLAMATVCLPDLPPRACHRCGAPLDPEGACPRAPDLCHPAAPNLAKPRRAVVYAPPEHAAEDPGLTAFLHPAGRCICEGAGDGDCNWCEMNRRREAREDRPATRAEQRQRKAARTAKKARRGW